MKVRRFVWRACPSGKPAGQAPASPDPLPASASRPPSSPLRSVPGDAPVPWTAPSWQYQRPRHDRHLAFQSGARHQPASRVCLRTTPRAGLATVNGTDPVGRTSWSGQWEIEASPSHLPGAHRPPSDDIGLYRRLVSIPANFAGRTVLWHFDGAYDGAESLRQRPALRLPRERLHGF